MAKTKEERSMVAVKTSIKNRVAKKVAGTSITIGEYFEEAVKKELKPIKTQQS